MESLLPIVVEYGPWAASVVVLASVLLYGKMDLRFSYRPRGERDEAAPLRTKHVTSRRRS